MKYRMDTRKLSAVFPVAILLYFLAGLAGLLSACGKDITPAATVPVPLLVLPSATPASPPAPVATPTLACFSNLSFVDDITIPDNTVVAPGTEIDKQWLVLNSGNCNWDQRYRLRLISGIAMGAPTEQALYPARAGAQVILRSIFTAPKEAGVYISEWLAYDPNGMPFGESFFIKIIVQP